MPAFFTIPMCESLYSLRYCFPVLRIHFSHNNLLHTLYNTKKYVKIYFVKQITHGRVCVFAHFLKFNLAWFLITLHNLGKRT